MPLTALSSPYRYLCIFLKHHLPLTAPICSCLKCSDDFSFILICYTFHIITELLWLFIWLLCCIHYSISLCFQVLFNQQICQLLDTRYQEVPALASFLFCCDKTSWPKATWERERFIWLPILGPALREVEAGSWRCTYLLFYTALLLTNKLTPACYDGAGCILASTQTAGSRQAGSVS